MDSLPAPWIVRTADLLPDAAEAALDRLDAVRTLVLDSAGAWADFGREVRDACPRHLVAVGGDGTVQGVVRAIGEDAECVLGIVPMGTGNDFARALGLPLETEPAVEVIRSGRTRRVDLMSMVRDGDEAALVVNAVTIGLSGAIHAELDDETKERWGRFAYLRAALRAATDLTPFAAALEVADSADGDLREFWSGELLHISLANGTNAGGGVPIAPGAELDDGLLDVCGVAEGSTWEIGSGMPALLTNGDTAEPWVLASAKRVRLRMESARPASIDGELRDAKTLDLRLLARALAVRAPRP
jgi:diacylglycerol kinase (ATP)